MKYKCWNIQLEIKCSRQHEENQYIMKLNTLWTVEIKK